MSTSTSENASIVRTLFDLLISKPFLPFKHFEEKTIFLIWGNPVRWDQECVFITRRKNENHLNQILGTEI